MDTQNYKFADITEDQLQKIDRLQDELCSSGCSIVLIAYEKKQQQ